MELARHWLSTDNTVTFESGEAELQSLAALLDKARDEATLAEREQCAKVAEDIWDHGKQGAHGGEQANRTAAAIRSRATDKDGGTHE